MVYLLNLTEFETGQLVRDIEPELLLYANQNDEQKYPPAELIRLRRVFKKPESVAKGDILAALVWKYGHTGKLNFPRRQRELAARIAEMWSDSPMRSSEPPLETFQRWRTSLGQTSFVTICFLLHLVHSDALPILDQHNYRAVNRHLAAIHPDLNIKAKPSQFEDLLLVRDFDIAVLGGWERYSESEKPTADILDRYLMMRGKALKSRRRQIQTP